MRFGPLSADGTGTTMGLAIGLTTWSSSSRTVSGMGQPSGIVACVRPSAQAFGLTGTLNQVRAEFGEFVTAGTFCHRGGDIFRRRPDFERSIGQRRGLVGGEDHRVGGKVGPPDQAPLLVRTLTARLPAIATAPPDPGTGDLSAAPQAGLGAAGHGGHVGSPYWRRRSR